MAAETVVAGLTTSLAVGDTLPAAVFRQVWLDTVFECFKLDPQFGDTSTLAPWPLVMKAGEWAVLAQTAERLAAETLAAELELPHRPGLLRELALPRQCRNAIREAASRGAPPAIARVMRFDFHPTAQGWQVSEVNCDVPGGFIEASGFTSMMAARFPGLRPAGDPTAALVDALGKSGPVGLVHATGYLDDRQVMHFLQRALRDRGVDALLLGPDEVAWKDGFASACGVALGAIYRFFPGEWLPNLGWRSGWQHYFRDSKTPQCNPATTLAAQSKRLPLVWDRLGGSYDTWRSALPETRAAQGVVPDDTWVLKAALGRVGEEVGIKGVTAEKELRKIERWARRRPKCWIAQRRFEALALPAGGGSIYPCIGVFTVDGKACGAYGRAASRALVDGNSRDVAVLLED